MPRAEMPAVPAASDAPRWLANHNVAKILARSWRFDVGSCILLLPSQLCEAAAARCANTKATA
jgi:hypothetical protein